MDATPEGHPDQAARLSNLGAHLSSRYKRTGKLQDLEAAIARSQAAVDAIPEGHPDQAARLYNLGACFDSYNAKTGNLQSLEAALAAWVTSYGIITAPILVRIESARRAAKALVFSPLKDVRACSLLRNVVYLMPLATPRLLEREDQQHILGQLTGVVSHAISVSLEAGGSPLESLRLQKLGRSVTNGQLLDYRSDISHLTEHHPTLAQGFDSLCQELDSPFPSLQASVLSMDQRLRSQQSTIRRRNQVAQHLDKILLQIRQQPGFENFLRAESEAYLLSAAQGPIVVLNVTELRSDAILLTKAEVRSIALPHLSHASMSKYGSTSPDAEGNEVTRGFLEWLWKADPLPRIWWTGLGIMAKAPIHAAAKFRNRRIQMTILQYCIPSYTSTIRVLQYSQSRQCQQNSNASMLMVVGNTLGQMQGQTEGRSWARKATLNYASRNWDARKGKFEFWIEGYKERYPAWNKRRTRTLGP